MARLLKKETWKAKLLILIALVIITIYLFPIEYERSKFIKNLITDKQVKLAEVNDYDLVRDKLFEIVETEDPLTALNYLAQEMKINSQIEAKCHALVHEVGNKANEKFKNIQEALQYQDDLCGSGYLHGVVESVFINTKDLSKEMDTICKGIDTLNYTSKCYHGVGHGLMYFTGNDLPKSLDLCSEYRKKETRISCSEGVFMENFSVDGKLHTSKFTDASDPSYPCASQNLFYKGTCYFYAPIYYLNLYPNDYLAGFDWCDTLDKGFINRCISGFASRAMKQNVNNRKIVQDLCTYPEQKYKTPCIDGMIGYYLLATGSLKEGEKMCSELRSPYEKVCMASIDARREQYIN